VQGGVDTEVAQTILDYKTPGTNTYGTTSIPLTDPKGVPITINFFRPTVIPVAVSLTVSPGTGWVTSNTNIIAAAIAAFISTLAIGQDVIVTQLYAIAYVPGTSAAGSFFIEGEIKLAASAGGFIEFTGNPANLDTVTVNGVTITFVTGTPTGNQVYIGSSAGITAANLESFLSGSTNASLTVATYTLTGNFVNIEYLTPGPTGDTYTLTASSAGITLSGSVLAGGAFSANDLIIQFNQLAYCQASYVSITT
jgi:hypothetical protein